jgi:hypothetical protein
VVGHLKYARGELRGKNILNVDHNRNSIEKVSTQNGSDFSLRHSNAVYANRACVLFQLSLRLGANYFVSFKDNS